MYRSTKCVIVVSCNYLNIRQAIALTIDVPLSIEPGEHILVITKSNYWYFHENVIENVLKKVTNFVKPSICSRKPRRVLLASSARSSRSVEITAVHLSPQLVLKMMDWHVLSELLACCPMIPKYYLNQCQLIHSPTTFFSRDDDYDDVSHSNMFDSYACTYCHISMEFISYFKWSCT